MRIKLLALATLVMIGQFVTTPASAQMSVSDFFRYAPNGCDFRVMLPEAPTVKTIRPHHDIPYWDISTSSLDRVGEYGHYERKKPDTASHLKVELYCVNLGQDHNQNMTAGNMLDLLEKDSRLYGLVNVTHDFKESANGAMKWATLAGDALTESNTQEYRVMHLLIGPTTVFMVNIIYSGSDEDYEQTIKLIAESIMLNY